VAKFFVVYYQMFNNKLCFFFFFQPNSGHGLLILEVSSSHTTTHHSRLDSSGRVTISSQRPLPDNTRHSTNDKRVCPSAGFELTISAGERQQNYALDSAATGTGRHAHMGTASHRGLKGPRRDVNHPLTLDRGQRKSRAIPLLPLCVLMTSCGVTCTYIGLACW
jgi:hypothetical protein